jgi:hypothetical protein
MASIAAHHRAKIVSCTEVGDDLLGVRIAISVSAPRGNTVRPRPGPGSAPDPRSAVDSIPKKLLKPLRRQRGIARRILDVAMPEIGLDRARVVAIVRQLIAAGMT